MTMQQYSLYPSKPSSEIARYQSMPLPPEPSKKVEVIAKAWEVYVDSRNAESYESFTGASIYECQVNTTSFYEPTQLTRDLDRFSRCSTYSDNPSLLSSTFNWSGTLGDIAEQEDNASLLQQRQSLLPAPIKNTISRQNTESIECRLSSCSQAPDPKRSASPARLIQLTSDLKHFAADATLPSSDQRVSSVPSLTHSLSRRSSAETVLLSMETSPISKKGTRSKPGHILTSDFRNISPPMPSPCMQSSPFGGSLSPAGTNDSAVELLYQQSRAAPAAERSAFDDWSDDNDDEQHQPPLRRVKKSFSNFRDGYRSKVDLSERTQKKAVVAFANASDSSPPLPHPIRKYSSTYAVFPKPDASIDTTCLSRNAVGQASLRLQSPAKLSKKPSIKQTRQRAGTSSSQASTAGKSSTTSATLVRAQSPTPINAKKRFSFAISAKSTKSQRSSMSRFRRWARNVFRC